MREIRQVEKFPKLWKLEVFSKTWEQRDKRIWEYENREIREYENMRWDYENMRLWDYENMRLWVTETGNMRYKRIWQIYMNEYMRIW